MRAAAILHMNAVSTVKFPVATAFRKTRCVFTYRFKVRHAQHDNAKLVPVAGPSPATIDFEDRRSEYLSYTGLKGGRD